MGTLKALKPKTKKAQKDWEEAMLEAEEEEEKPKKKKTTSEVSEASARSKKGVDQVDPEVNSKSQKKAETEKPKKKKQLRLRPKSPQLRQALRKR